MAKKIWFKFFHTAFLGETSFLTLEQTGAAARLLATIAADGEDGFLSLPAEIWARKIGSEKTAFFGLLEALKFCRSFSIFVSEDGETVAVSASMIEEDANERAAKSKRNAAYRSRQAGLRAVCGDGVGVGSAAGSAKRLGKDAEKTEKSHEKVGYACAEKWSEEEEERKRKEKERIFGDGGGADPEEDVPYDFGGVAAPAAADVEPAAPAALAPAGVGSAPPPEPAASLAVGCPPGASRGDAVPGAPSAASVGASVRVLSAAEALGGGGCAFEPAGARGAPFSPAAGAFPARPSGSGRLSCPAASRGDASPGSPVAVADPEALRAVLRSVSERLSPSGTATGEHAAERPAFAAFWRVYPNPAKNGRKEDAAWAEWVRLAERNPSAELAVPLWCALTTLLDQWPKPWAPGVNPLKSHAKFLRERAFENREKFGRLATWAASADPARWALLEPLWRRVEASAFFADGDRRARLDEIGDSGRATLELVRNVFADPEAYRADGESVRDVMRRAREQLAAEGLSEADLELVGR